MEEWKIKLKEDYLILLLYSGVYPEAYSLLLTIISMQDFLHKSNPAKAKYSICILPEKLVK